MGGMSLCSVCRTLGFSTYPSIALPSILRPYRCWSLTCMNRMHRSPPVCLPSAADLRLFRPIEHNWKATGIRCSAMWIGWLLCLDQSYSRVTLFAPGMPPLVCSARTRIPPSADQPGLVGCRPCSGIWYAPMGRLEALEGDTCLFISELALQHRERA